MKTSEEVRLESRTPRSAEACAEARRTALGHEGSERRIAVLEREWGSYKYAVLERSPRIYQSIRALLRDKAGYPAAEFYRLVDAALSTPSSPQIRANAASHVWGYFKDVADEADREEYRRLMASYLDGEATIAEVKRFLWRMSVAHGVEYLLESTYFTEP